MTDRPRTRRFYKSATVADDGVGVMLDERRLRTPRNAVFSAATPALAQAMVAEWNAQGEDIAPATMPLTQLAFAAIDRTPQRRVEIIDYIAKFAETDLVCHRAAAPAELVRRQSDAWDPLVAWAASELGVVLPVVTGVVAAPIPVESIEALRAHAGACGDFELTALAQAAGLAGSALLALALLRGRLDARTAFAAAALDDIWSQEKWGYDPEAAARLDRQRREFDNVARFIALLTE